ncbi:MAG: hypothetical protein PUH25_07040 [Spirochaetales bacterium]|nr:hypothetical protein [Spirochaetales bacterium]
MKKHLWLLFTIIAFCFVLISCPNPSEEMKPSTPILDNPSVTIIEKKLIKPGETYTLDGEYTLRDGIVISKATSKAISDTSTKYFKTGNGSLIPLPNKDKKITISAADLDITSNTDVYIGKYNVESDFMISAKEMEANNKRGFYDEYYYVDLTDDKWSSLNRENIVVRQTSHPGDGSYSVLINESSYSNTKDVLNLDGADGFAVYQYTTRELGFNSIPDCKIHVVNPIDLTVGQEVEVKDLFSVLRIPVTNDQQEYCITISGIPSEVISRMAGVYYFTNFGVTRKFTEDGVIPYYYPSEGKIIYHLGKIQDTFMIDLDFEEYYTKATNINAKVTLEVNNYPNIVNKDNYIDLSEVANGQLDIRAPYTSSDYITLAFELNDVLTVKTDYVANGLRDAMGKFWSDSSSGIFKLPFESNYTFKKAPLVAFVTLNTNGEEIKQGEVLYTISESQISKLPVGHTYTYKPIQVGYWYGQYFSENDRISFIANDFNHEFGEEFNNEVFTCNKTIEGLGILTINNKLLKSSEITGAGISTRYGVTQKESKVYRSFSKENLLVRFEVDEIVYNSIYDKALKGKIYIVRDGNETVVDDVVFSFKKEVEHTHIYDEGVILDKPTYLKKGSKVYTCECGITKNEEIEYLSLNNTNWITSQKTGSENNQLDFYTGFHFEDKNSFMFGGYLIQNQDGTNTLSAQSFQSSYSLDYDNSMLSLKVNVDNQLKTFDYKIEEEIDEDGNVVYITATDDYDTLTLHPINFIFSATDVGNGTHSLSSNTQFDINNESIDQIIIAPTAHTGKISVITSPTYFKNGNYHVEKCDVCGGYRRF